LKGRLTLERLTAYWRNFVCAPLDGTTMNVNVEYVVKFGIMSSGGSI